jgi:hypothetical protein
MENHGVNTPATESKKKCRSVWLDKVLTAKGYNNYGRATEISKRLHCGMSSVQGWMRGSLPRDMELAYRFCETYGVDMVEWVSLEPSEWRGETPSLEDMQIVVGAIRNTIDFELSLVTRETPRPLSISSFVKVFQIILKNLREPDLASTESLEFIHDFVKETDNVEDCA